MLNYSVSVSFKIRFSPNLNLNSVFELSCLNVVVDFDSCEY